MLNTMNVDHTASVPGAVLFGSSISVRCSSELGEKLSAFDATAFGSSLSVASFVRLGIALSVSTRVSSGEILSVADVARFGSTLSVQNTAQIGGGSLSGFGRINSGSWLVLDSGLFGSSVSVAAFIHQCGSSCLTGIFFVKLYEFHRWFKLIRL